MMELDNLNAMVRGWFVGDFEPNVVKTKDFEVGIKTYKAGDYEEEHFHKIGTEITVILDGEARMKGSVYKHGDIITIPPMESTDFEALTDVKTVVVKIPSARNDKFIV